ncbi:spermatogenesis-associated protein 1 [Pelodytes ibericus]
MDTHQAMNPSLYPTRPSTSGLIDLHVYYVPDDVWNVRLNKVPIESINKFVSVGFIRAPPDMKLRTLRERLGEFLGDETPTEKFAFLKCVGRSLAVVKAKQELEVKLKSFAPPYANQPELYLLPGVDTEGSSYGSSVTPDEQGSHVDRPLWEEPSIHPSLESSRHVPKLDLTERDHLILSSKEEEAGSSIVILNNQKQNPGKPGPVVPTERVSDLGYKNEIISKLPGTNTTSDSGISDTFRVAEREQTPRRRDKEHMLTERRIIQGVGRNNQFGDNSFRPLPEPAQYQSPPSPPPLPAFPPIKSPPLGMNEPEETLLKQLEKVKEERLKLEKSREELVKRTRSLLEQYKLRRYQVRDSWKKKYFETKKVTSALEETLGKLRTELEFYYQKLLTQLAARDSRKHSKYPTLAANSKNSTIMTITSRQQEVDQMKRKVDNARIKLLIEIKMRKQAASDLSVLKAQLAHKKAQSTIINHPMFAV